MFANKTISKFLFYPAWDIYDRSIKLLHLHKLEKDQWLSLDEIEFRQLIKLRKIINYAYHYSGYYKKVMDDNHISPDDIKNFEDLEHFPITTKSDIRNNIDRFISTEFVKQDLLTSKTGGSTGISLQLYFNKRCQEKRNAAQIMVDRWSGWDLGMPKALVWGNPPIPHTTKQKLRNYFLDKLIFLDTMKITEENVQIFVDTIRNNNIRAIFGHAHSIYIVGDYIRKLGITNLNIDSIVATSMMLLDIERNHIEQTFNCSVTNRYGCEEVGLIACECDIHKGMHLNLHHLVIQTVDTSSNEPVSGKSGKLILTDLINNGMPLIRYQVEDIGRLEYSKCPCGRHTPLLARLEGRTADFLVKDDGTRIAGISLIENTLTNIPGIKQMQIIQNTIDQIIINRVKDDLYTISTDIDLTDYFKQVFGGDINLIIKNVDSIKQENSGKYRFSICNI